MEDGFQNDFPLQSLIIMYSQPLFYFETTNHSGSKRISIPIPKKLCVHDESCRDDCLEILEAIRVNSQREKNIHIDLSRVDSISASGAVAFFSYVTSIQIMNGDDYFSFSLPEDRKTKAQIRLSGLWEAIRSGGKRKLERLWNSPNRFQSGYNPDIHLDPTIKNIKEEIGLPYRLKEAISETMLNIVQHAYGHLPGAITRWWQYASIDRTNNSFIFVICDRGCTIPYTFRGNKNDDAAIIEHAMQKGISSTGLAWRGKGSDDIKKPVNPDINDKLVVVSRNGMYKYLSDSTPIEKHNLKQPFHGTLVAWSFDLRDHRIEEK